MSGHPHHKGIGSQSGPIKVLLVEDNPVDAYLLRRIVAEAGGHQLELVHVDRLAAAFQRLAEERFDVMLLDLYLPDGQGIDTLIRAHQQVPAVPIVVLTGLNDEALAIQAVQEGAQDYLVKGSVDKNLLVRAVRYARERKRLEHQLLESQKMEAVARLAGGVAHDFNNLLQVITGYAQMLLNGLAPHDPVREDLDEILKSADRAATLTNQLLAFSRRQVVQPKILDMNAQIEGLVERLRRLAGDNIQVIPVLSPDLHRVKADSAQIEQVVLNLAAHARDAMPQGGKLTIETSNVSLAVDYVRTHMGVAPGRYVMLAVSDTGGGMDSETQSHLFEPFFAPKLPGKSAGLRLSTVYGIVKQSGGDIWVYSEPGLGTTFKIYIPATAEGVAEAEAPASVRPVEQRKGTILLAEDEGGVRRLVREILKQQGYTVIEAGDGEEALRLCEQHDGPIHLLLTDVVMPGMNGRELAEKAGSLRPALKVLYVSGYTEHAIVHNGVLEAGMQFLQKPFTPATLTRKVQELFEAA
jgi:signal transduction histidine kinase